MKKLALFFALFLLVTLLPARNLVLVNYIHSELGGRVMEKLLEYGENNRWYPLADAEKPGDICLFVKEFDPPRDFDHKLSFVSITFTVVKEAFGDYTEFIPLDSSSSRTWYVGTELVVLDPKKMERTLDTMIEQVDMRIALFLSIYENFAFEEYAESPQGMLEDTLKNYCQNVLDLWKTPARQGGLGQKITSKSKKDLARGLGFDPNTGSTFIPFLEYYYSIRELGRNRIVIEADLAGPFEMESTPLLGIIDLENDSFLIVPEDWDY